MPVKEEKEEKSVLVPEVVVEVAPELVPEPTPEPQPVLTPAKEADTEVIEKSDRSWVWMLLAFVLGLAAGGVGGFVLAKIQNSRTKSDQPVAGKVVTSTPSPSPAAVVQTDRADLKVQVLNGSGVKGEAARAKEFLEGLGYKDVKVGNADADAGLTVVEFKKGAEKYVDTLTNDLSKKYKLGPNVNLSEDAEFDVIVTLGAE